jgi:multiple antibiotic resistance protein
MKELMGYLPHTFIPLFVAMDIVAVLPIFLSLTHGLSRQDQKKAVRDSVATALLVGILFIAMGEGIFGILGVTNDDFKIAGGLVLLVFAVLDLIRRDPGPPKVSGKLGIVPLGVPLIVGPAVLTTLIVLVDHYGIAVTGVSFLLNLLIVWLVLRKSAVVVSVLGNGGILAVSKVMALLLASIAVMMIRIGMQNIAGRGMP